MNFMVNGTIKLVPITKQNNYFISLQLLCFNWLRAFNVNRVFLDDDFLIDTIDIILRVDY